MGAKDDEWSGQIIKTVQAVKSGALEQSDVRVYVGGPHGNLQVQPANVDHVVLCAGGIGVTPMAAILEDRVRRAGESQSQTTLIWTTRAPSEMKAFAYLFDAIAALPAEQKKRFDVRVFVTSGKENTADVEASASKIVKHRSTPMTNHVLGTDTSEVSMSFQACTPAATLNVLQNGGGSSAHFG